MYVYYFEEKKNVHCFTQGSSFLRNIDEKLCGMLVLRCDDDDGEFLWAHSTPAMCIGYMNTLSNKAKVMITFTDVKRQMHNFHHSFLFFRVASVSYRIQHNLGKQSLLKEYRCPKLIHNYHLFIHNFEFFLFCLVANFSLMCCNKICDFFSIDRNYLCVFILVANIKCIS